MQDLSLEPLFIPLGNNLTSLPDTLPENINLTAMRHAIESLPFNDSYDSLRAAAHKLVTRSRTPDAIRLIEEFDASVTRMGEESGALLDIHSALMQILTALHMSQGNMDQALTTAATTLNLLAQEPRRKDEPFLTILASLLYDVAMIHNTQGQYKQAEREIEKTMKIFERLARTNPQRYGAAHLLAMNASTQVYRSRIKQANMLAQYQAATAAYLNMYNEGIEDAGMKLIDSLTQEGHTLAKMTRHREAVQYFTRALKYLTKLQPEFGLQHLTLSIDLGEALLSVKASRDKGIHLLNTMLYKSIKINAADQHTRIVNILLAAKTSSMDIFSFWHKIFPK